MTDEPPRRDPPPRSFAITDHPQALELARRLTALLRAARRGARSAVASGRRVGRVRTRLAALSRRDEGAGTSKEPPRVALLAFAGESALPPELRDESIVHEAELWAARISSVRSADLLTYRPLVSILMPTYETPLDVLELAVASVLAQTYEHWELVIVDDGSASAELHEYLSRLPARNPRIGVTLRPTNSGVSAATNAALELAAGEFVGMLDHDDELHPTALAEIVRSLNADPSLDAVYTDQEYIERDGSASDVLLKPDWSPRLFWGVMYVGHLLVLRRSAALSLGGFDPSFDNVQDFEFMLRLSEQTGRIAHVPKVLYKWRRIPGSVAFHGDEKSEIDELQAAAVTAHFNRTGIAAVARSHVRHAHRTTIVPRRRESATVTVVLDAPDSRSTELSREALSAQGDARIDVVALKPGTRLDSIVPSLRTDYLVSLDSGLVLESEDWLDHLLLYADLPDVATVAPLILDRTGRVEQAGLILGANGEWEHAMRGWNPAEDGYAGSLSCARDVSAISGAGALISRATLNELGGFSGAFATVDLTWVELSVRAAAAGLSNVVTPQSVLRRLGVPPAVAPVLDRQLLREASTGPFGRDDPFHNPGFADVAGGYQTQPALP